MKSCRGRDPSSSSRPNAARDHRASLSSCQPFSVRERRDTTTHAVVEWLSAYRDDVRFWQVEGSLNPEGNQASAGARQRATWL
ncbi:MAG: hypothetical protein ACXU86_24185 [Archangium sp.]